MPTVSEPTWPAQVDKRIAAVQMFLEGRISVDVLSASLYATGLRGQDLESEVFNAKMDKAMNDRLHLHEPKTVLVLERDHTSSSIRFTNAEAAANAVSILRRQPNVVFACRVRATMAEPIDLSALIAKDNKDYVTELLSLLQV